MADIQNCRRKRKWKNKQISNNWRLRRRKARVVFIANSDNSFQVLSTIARLSGGTYDELPEIVSDWRKFRGRLYRFNDPMSSKDETSIAERYLSPMVLCGKPDSIDLRRWFIKCLSNDQTAFTGFTSLVDVVESEEIGFDGIIRLLPSASFVEPFAIERLDSAGREKLFGIKERLDKLDSTRIEEVSALIGEAEALCPVTAGRKKGKSPIFFYGVSDKPFRLPETLYKRLEETAKSAYAVLCSATEDKGRNIFTGSVDFMLCEDKVYLIDIGTPAVGYVADILATSRALGRTPFVGIEKIVSTLNGRVTIPKTTLSQELGFFKQEREYLISELRRMGIQVEEVSDNGNEAIIDGKSLPTKEFDYLSRNQPLRNRILMSINGDLSAYGVKIPDGIVLQPDDFALARFYEKTRLGEEDYGLLIKKKVFFKEYETGSGYFKPLVTPIWGREIMADNKRSNLFEQFVPSLLDIDVEGDKRGKRCYEIRMYFVGGEIK
jgi:hypothetical protein